MSRATRAYWRPRLFKNKYMYRGRRFEVPSWSVKIQVFGQRKAFTLESGDRTRAAGEACRIYNTILEHGWGAVTSVGRGLASSRPTVPILPDMSQSRHDTEDWKRRLIHRSYPELSPLSADRPYSVRIEHAGASYYFPLGTSDETRAATLAARIYRTVVDEGWPKAMGCFPCELSLALRWHDNPLAWTYTTIHTHDPGAAPRGRLGQEPSAERRVVVIEPDAGIRQTLAACANSHSGFRCEATFGSAAEALRALSRTDRAELALVNHDLPDEPDATCLEELQALSPGPAVLSYSVFEDADQLFKSTPGGAVAYMLKRTPPTRLFEPIEDLAGPLTREQMASEVRNYFQRMSTALPSGPPFWQLARLTPREHEILAFLSKGHLVKEIAHLLGISNWTAQGHVKSVLAKLRVHTRTEAVIKYLQK